MAQVSRTETRSRRPQMSAPNAPSLPLDSPVDAADRVSAIDFINRVNWLFDAWDIDAMVEAFLPDSVTHHTHGVVRGRIETRRFFQEQIPYTVPGTSAGTPPTRSLIRTTTMGDRPLSQSSRPLFSSGIFASRIVGGQVVAEPHGYARALGLLGDDGPLAAQRWRMADLRTPCRADVDERRPDPGRRFQLRMHGLVTS